MITEIDKYIKQNPGNKIPKTKIHELSNCIQDIFTAIEDETTIISELKNDSIE